MKPESHDHHHFARGVNNNGLGAEERQGATSLRNLWENHLAEDQKKMHHMNCYEAKTGIVLKQQMVAEKEGELTRVKEFLTPTLLQGRIMSADALYAQTRFCQEVIAAGGDYLLFVKQNQPTFYEDVSLFFREPPPDCLDWRTASTTNKGHGRVEKRIITVSIELNDAFGSRLARCGTGLLLTLARPTCSHVYESLSCMALPASHPNVLMLQACWN